ncbi:UNVERIFIED_CONTAM: hypothetical protein FKN15_065297 [Acipenser sinensis]
MPIRRSAGTPSQETAPKNPPAADADASSEESVSAEEEHENEAPAAAQPQEEEVKQENEKAETEEEKKEEEKPAEEQKKDDKDAVKEKEKKVKKTIPAWATMSAKQLARSQKHAQVTLFVRPKMDAILTEAIQACFQKSGASAFAIKKYIVHKYPSLELDKRGYLLKQALKRELQRGAVRQVGWGHNAYQYADASSEESVSAEEEHENEAPAAAQPQEEEVKQENEKAETEEEKKEEEKPAEEQKKDDKDAVKEKEKKVKKTIPAWATMSAKQLARSQKHAQVTLFVRPKMDAILTEAIQACFQKSGASAFAIKKYIVHKYPSLELDKRGYLLKQALKRELQRGAVRQVKGKGFSGSFTVVSSNSKQSQKSRKVKGKGFSGSFTVVSSNSKQSLIFTRLCEPKEASYVLIKKYVEQYFPKLMTESRPHMLKNALQRAVEKGQLEQLTGKGASGTFQLKKLGDKPLLSGGPFEDAILSAITAMNEPKTCSTTALKKFVLENSQGGKVNLQVNNLKRTLRRCEMFGWMEQISGKGFSGTFQLCFPYYPSPTILFPDKHKEEDSVSEEEDSEEESEEDSEEESEDEPPPKKRQIKRPPPKVRIPPPPKHRKLPARKKRSGGSAQKVSAPAFTPRGKKPAPAKKAAPAKKVSTPVKKAAPPPKAAATKKAAPPTKAAAIKKTAPPPQAAAPPNKPKTPATKKMTNRAPKKSPAKTTPARSPVKGKPAARKSLRMRK